MKRLAPKSPNDSEALVRCESKSMRWKTLRYDISLVATPHGLAVALVPAVKICRKEASAKAGLDGTRAKTLKALLLVLNDSTLISVIWVA